MTHVRPHLLSAYLDQELTGDDRSRLARHLDICSVCRDELEGLQCVVGLARALPPVGAPETLRGGVRARLAAAARTDVRRDRAVAWALRAGAAAVIVMGLFHSGIARHPSHNGADMRNQAVQREAPSRATAATDNAALAPASAAAAQIDLQVDNQQMAVRRLLEIAKAQGGSAAASGTSARGARRPIRVTLHVPAARLGATVAQVEAVGTVQRRQIGERNGAPLPPAGGATITVSLSEPLQR